MNILTGIQSSGTITLGNYIGSIKNFNESIKDFNSFIFIANQHALTVRPTPKNLYANTKQLAALYIAMDMHKKSNIFIQSDIPQHSELCWILQCHAKIGELERMTQFKDKSLKNGAEASSVGLYTYPTLMAADILLYQTDIIPVGKDQKQHIEFTRDIANKFNNFYKTNIFKIPKAEIKKDIEKIYSLTNPEKKMSKSDENPKSFISILDDEKTIRNKIKSATTDSIGQINYDRKNQPGISNLLVIYSNLKNISMDDTLLYFNQKNYGFLKNEVANAITKEFLPFQKK